MPDKDISEKTLEAYNDVFADIANVLLFDGEQVIAEDELEDAVPYSMYKADEKLHEQERDCAKFWKRQKIRLALCGFENQTKQDKAMPLRVIGYDGAAYRAELNETTTDFYPVITLVLYFGHTHWRKPRRLKQCFRTDKRLQPFVSDYKINVIEVAFLEEEKIAKFKSDFKIIADFFVQSRLGKYKPSEDTIRHADEVFKLMSVLTGDKRFDETYHSYKVTHKSEQGGPVMCKVLDDMINEGMRQGIEQGLQQGVERLLNARAGSEEQIASWMNLSAEQVHAVAAGMK